MTKLRARRTPSNQAHVTNRLDDPLLLAADAATAAAYGFREIETTVPVLADAPSNAVAVTVGRGDRLGRRARAVLGRGGDGARDGHPRPGLLRRDRQPLRHRVGLRRRRRHAVQQGDPGRGLRQPRRQDAGLVRSGRRGADGRRRAVLDALPRVPLRVPGPGDGRPGRAERRHRRRQRRLVRAARRARADGRERDGDGPQPRGVHRQRRADVGVRRTPDLAHPADPARRQRLRVQRLRQHPALRQHVRAVAVERRGHRRLAGHAARLGCRRRAAHGACRPRWGGCDARRPRPAATSTATSDWPTSPTSTSTSPSTRSVRRTWSSTG